MDQEPNSRSYFKRFVIFQVSKYIWGLAVLLAVVSFYSFTNDKPTIGYPLAAFSFVAFYAAFRMGNQYRCPNPKCQKLLIFAHGSSGSSGENSHLNACPFCGEKLLSTPPNPA